MYEALVLMIQNWEKGKEVEVERKDYHHKFFINRNLMSFSDQTHNEHFYK